MQLRQNQVLDSSPAMDRRVLPVVTAGIAIVIFILDTFTHPEILVAMLYVGVVLLSAKFLRRRDVTFVSLGCMALVLLSYFLVQHGGSPSAALANRFISLAAIGITAFFAVQGQSRERVLSEQAGLLDLSHDTIFVRDMNDVITYWNRGAEELYGWKKEEAVGKVTHQLMQTVFPAPLEEITVALLRTGRWEGELVHTKKDGTQAVVASRWSVQLDALGNATTILETNNDITERKRAEEALRESEEQWKAAFENNPTVYFMVDAAGTMPSVNSFGAEQLGYSVDELVGSRALDVFHEPDREAARGHLARAFAQPGRSISWEARKVRKDGTVIWARETARSMLMGNRPVTLVACEDISERKLAEEAARRSEQELRDLIENLPVMAYIALPSPSGPFAAFASRRWREYSGLSEENTAGFGWQSATHPSDLERNLKKWQACAAAGEPYESESRYRRAADRAYRWFLDRAVPLKDERGAILKWYGVLTDIEDRKRAEDALRRKEHYLTEAQRLTHTGSFAYNPATQVLHWSEEMFRIYRLDPQLNPGLGLDDISRFWHPDDRDRALERITTSIREKAEYAIEYRIVLLDGTVKHLYSMAHPVFDDAGAVVEYIGTVMDITERKRAEEALQKAQTELAHVARVTTMGALTSSIAHEVNQPLGAIVTNANAALRWLAGRPPDIDEARATLGRIVRDGHRAADVIGGVRALLKKTAVVAAPLDLNKLIQDTATLVQGELRRHRILLRTELAPDLPPVAGDRVQLQQVILNLMMNGIEAMSEVTDRPRELLMIARSEASGAVLVAVKDAGTGLDTQSAEQLFEPFYTTKADGLGMGLAICRLIVEAHGGRLWASANEPRGAVFQFTLPTTQEKTAPAEPPSAMATV
ncbi:PAS domain S-box protein [Rhizobium sp. P32RR-XVIII]|uniref:PAS domain S-box protein n=1 Tax=Rhizobium sp. P32RR-XVIII TaxID=2726738 RepID=UPI0014567C25|nr:PAS domain S-box protein [Rhizobium sp. P32RR-XVIII]NLS03390.1 PAS domain S-box protein [Rhizobium sp. P32RR-XVIII]